MPKRDPFEVLGVEPGVSAATIKAAWRRLARTHHPDLVGNDAAAARRATREMAEINAAYGELSDPVRRTAAAEAARKRRRGGAAAAEPEAGADPGTRDGAGPDGGPATRRGGPPRPRPGRPVTGRLDMSDTFTPRNQTLSHRRAVPPGRHEPMPRSPEPSEAPRASDPTGPMERGRVLRFRRAAPPALADARALQIEFGKFHGHTLGEIAAFEPSYIDWIAKTITRDPELVAAARVIRDDLDARGVVRAPRPAPSPRGASVSG